jgi:hypothetical protein
VEGECPICHEDLDPSKEDVTFCRASCGQNVHEECMEQWMQAQKGTPRCPLCRKFWKQKREDLITLGEELDPDAVQVYLDWLYTKRIVFQMDPYGLEEYFSFSLLTAWIVAESMQDVDFRHQLVAKYVSATANGEDTSFGRTSIHYAFETESSPSMRAFVIDAFLVDLDPGWFDDSAHLFPANFLHKLCGSVLRSMKDQKRIHELLDTYTGGTYEFEESPDKDEDAIVTDEDEDEDENQTDGVYEEEDEAE